MLLVDNSKRNMAFSFMVVYISELAKSVVVFTPKIFISGKCTAFGELFMLLMFLLDDTYLE